MINGKKDTAAVRKDMQEKGIRPALWLVPDELRPNQWLMSQAPYSCTKAEWMTFLQRLENMRFPSGYAAVMKKHIRAGKLGSMKSHDYHVFMQQVLSICIRGLMQAPVRSAIMRICRVF
jgi:aspartate aminotransferase-like enzyme